MERLILNEISGFEDWGKSIYIFDKPHDLEVLNELWSESFLRSFPYWEKGSLKDLHNHVDCFKNDKFEIDLIFTQDRVIFIVRGSTRDLISFKETVFKYSDFKE